MEKDGEDQLQ